jgi:putative transposase
VDRPIRKTRKRYEIENQARFLTFSTYRRLPLFNDTSLKDNFARCLARARERLGFALLGWVVMPEHAHLLIVPRLPEAPVPRILNAIKAPLSRSALARWRAGEPSMIGRLTDATGVARFWQAGGGYDRNITSELFEKLRYIHWNPVKRGLCAQPEDWEWSSARWYKRMREGTVPIDSHLIGH